MLSERDSIREIINSRNGIHLTGYVKNERSDLHCLRSQVRDLAGQAEKFLEPVMTSAERKQFLLPLEKLADEDSLLSRLKRNFGLFRTCDSFRIVPIPVDVRPKCVVATTFHVKPLLKWIQSDQEFLLLGIGPTDVHLYSGNQIYLEKLGSTQLSADAQSALAEPHLLSQRMISRIVRENVRELGAWVTALCPLNHTRLYVAGVRAMSEAFLRSRPLKNIYRNPIWSVFSESQIPLIVDLIRKMNQRDGMLRIEKSIFEFSHAKEKDRLCTDLAGIARAAVQGRVRKLLVSDQIEIFGKLDAKNGQLKLHAHELDHEDDDLLDDLAQSVIASGGEVLIGHVGAMSTSSPILALVEQKEVESQVC
ncbi:MAG: hypothetical protein RLZZ488_1107 [Pseudomonadota bacterium]|jgi:hypothetical protein